MAVPSLIVDLVSALGQSKVITPESEFYNDALKRFSDSASKKAGVVVYPTSSQDVSVAIKLGTKHSVPLTAVGGGHGTSGDASSDGGMVIDLRKMRNVSVSPEEKTITCQGGCLWEEVDKAAGEHGLAIVGGTVNRTGVGGLTLGGGYGWLSGQYGLTIDLLLSAEVVLADGRIVTASATSEPDLFWCIRGAGHAFGVTTSFTFSGKPQTTPIWGGILMWPAIDPAIGPLVDFANSLVANSDGRAGVQIGFTSPPVTPGQLAVFAVCFFNGPQAEGEKEFGPLLNHPVTPVLNTLAEMPYSTMNTLLNMAAIDGGRRTSKGATFDTPFPPALFRKVLSAYEAFVARIPEVGEETVVLFEYYPAGVICAIPPTATAFSNRGKHQNAMINAKWKDPAHDAEIRQFTRDLMEMCKENGAGTGVGEYANYDGFGTPAEQIFGVNYERLRDLKGKYDPHNVFKKKDGLKGP